MVVELQEFRVKVQQEKIRNSLKRRNQTIVQIKMLHKKQRRGGNCLKKSRLPNLQQMKCRPFCTWRLRPLNLPLLNQPLSQLLNKAPRPLLAKFRPTEQQKAMEEKRKEEAAAQ